MIKHILDLETKIRNKYESEDNHHAEKAAANKYKGSTHQVKSRLFLLEITDIYTRSPTIQLKGEGFK